MMEIEPVVQPHNPAVSQVRSVNLHFVLCII